MMARTSSRWTSFRRLRRRRGRRLRLVRTRLPGLPVAHVRVSERAGVERPESNRRLEPHPERRIHVVHVEEPLRRARRQHLPPEALVGPFVQALLVVTDARDVEEADAVPVPERGRSRVGEPSLEICGGVGPAPAPGRRRFGRLAGGSVGGGNRPAETACERREAPATEREGGSEEEGSSRGGHGRNSWAVDNTRWRRRGYRRNFRGGDPITGWRGPKVKLR